METALAILFGVVILFGSAYLSWWFSRRATELHTEQLAEALAQNLLHLDPNNRYILSFPFDISDADFDELVEKMRQTLDLENSNTHIVIVQGKVTMVEFS